MLHGDFIINEGQQLAISITDSGLGGKTLTLSTKEMEPASGDMITSSHIETEITPHMEVRMSYRDSVVGTEVSITSHEIER